MGQRVEPFCNSSYYQTAIKISFNTANLVFMCIYEILESVGMDEGPFLECVAQKIILLLLLLALLNFPEIKTIGQRKQYQFSRQFQLLEINLLINRRLKFK